MKRFLISIIVTLLLGVACFYLYYAEGCYIDMSQAPVTASFHIKDNQIYHKNGSHDQPFVIKGVEVDGAYGPKRGTDFSIDEQTWKRWFKMIQQMGANTVRVSSILDDQFYNAIHQYNKGREQPLYMLQGIQVATDEWKTGTEKENMQFYQTLKKDGKDIVDLIHGRKLLLANDHKGSGIYRHDVSPWVIGYLIGDYWDQDVLAYLNESLDNEDSFVGNYVTTAKDATTYEVMMAKVIDHIVSYETKKYDSQRPISVNSSFTMDPFQYKEHFALQLGKHSSFSIEHIIPTKNMKSGLFASYAYEEQKQPALHMIENEEIAVHPKASSYLEFLYKAHKVPVVISSFGYPGESYLNHQKQQKTELVARLKQFDDIGFNGAFIRSWQDVWNRRTPETSYAVDLQQVNEWHDPLTQTQHFGLIGFKPYRDDAFLMKADGKDDDWQDVSPIFKNDTTKIAMTRDHAYVYLWIEDPSIKNDKSFYVAIDTHPKLGSKKPEIVHQTFDQNVDFVIKTTSKQGARVYVQDRYQSVRQNFLEQTSGENPYADYPRRDSKKFKAMEYLQRNQKFLTEEELQRDRVYPYSLTEMKPLRPAGEGNTEEADVAMQNGRLEIRLPYQLLNVYDPLKFTIHDDYYNHYGVEPLAIDSFYLSFASDRKKPSKSVEIPVQRLKPSVRVKEFVKPAYESVKNYWEGED